MGGSSPCSPRRPPLEVLQEVLDLPEQEKLLSVAMLWTCWEERNRGNHGEQYFTVGQFQYNAHRHVNEWNQFFQKNKQNQQVPARRWELPPPHFVKINTDAAYHDDTKSGGWGAICRDTSNDIQFATVGSLHTIRDGLHAETLALSNAMQVAEQFGVGRVIFETDCITLQQAMTTTKYDYTHLGILFSDLKFRLASNFIDARVMYAPRICNKPAHALAALGVGVARGEHSLWVTSYPTSVTRLVSGDSAGS